MYQYPGISSSEMRLATIQTILDFLYLKLRCYFFFLIVLEYLFSFSEKVLMEKEPEIWKRISNLRISLLLTILLIYLHFFLFCSYSHVCYC